MSVQYIVLPMTSQAHQEDQQCMQHLGQQLYTQFIHGLN